MPELLLSTKLYIPPPRPDLIPRPRLIQRLDEGLRLGHRLALLSAPPGFGKTTLLSSWAAGCRFPVAWIALDKGDNDPARFLAYLSAALQTISGHGDKDRHGVFQSPQALSTEAALTLLINEVASLPDGLVLILDDYHRIDAPAIHDTLAFLLEHLPPPPRGVHLVIATRADLPLPIARLRGQGQITELRAADLRFTSDEATALLNKMAGASLTARDVAALEARTEGWAVGLQLAALSLRGQEVPAQFIQSFAGDDRYVSDYLVEEVLSRQPEDVRRFLLQTAILDRFCAPLCDTVCFRGAEMPDSRRMIEYLEQANLFVVPLDNRREWYRFHHLFADLLYYQQRCEHPRRLPELHRRASVWFEENSYLAEAADHALAAKDLERASHLVEQLAPMLFDRGEMTTLAGWLEALPDDAVLARPWLCIFDAWLLLYAGQLDAIERRLQQTVQAQAGTDAAALQEHIAAIRTYAAFLRGDLDRAVEHARTALQQLPPSDSWARSFTLMTWIASCWLSGDITTMDQKMAEAMQDQMLAAGGHMAIMGLCAVALMQSMRGQLHRAMVTYTEALQLADQQAGLHGQRSPLAGYPLLGMSDLLREWNALEAAARYAREGISLCEQWGQAEVLMLGYLTVSRVLQSIADTAGASAALEKAEQIARKMSAWAKEHVKSQQARLYLSQDDVDTASRLVAEYELDREDGRSIKEELAHFPVARVLIARHRPEEALRLLERLLEMTESSGLVGSQIEVLTLQALARWQRGDTAQALDTLSRALSLAEPEGYVRLFADEGASLAAMLRAFSHQPSAVSREYLGRLLAACDAEQSGGLSPTPLLFEPLSERELEVLRLVAAGLKNKEIAGRLFISQNTVRFHTKNIYGKLDVHNRTQAVTKARELHLL